MSAACPPEYAFETVIEPLRDLYKDEVREVAGALGLPQEIQHRMPFPGPGLAVRVLGEVTREKVEVVREANCDRRGGARRGVPPLAVLCCPRSASAPGSRGRPAPWLDRLRPGRQLAGRDDCRPARDPVRVARPDRLALITAEIPSVARVVYDITPKPPATIEYE